MIDKGDECRMEKIRKIDSSTRYLDKALEYVALICLLISVIGAIINVILRYIFGMSFEIIEEICRYSIIYGVFAYIAPLIKRNEHLKMSILKDRLTGRIAKLNNLVISVFLFFAFIILFWSSIVWISSLISVGVMTVSGSMLMFIPALSIPIGMFLGALYSLVQIVSDFYHWRFYHLEEKDNAVRPEVS